VGHAEDASAQRHPLLELLPAGRKRVLGPAASAKRAPPHQVVARIRAPLEAEGKALHAAVDDSVGLGVEDNHNQLRADLVWQEPLNLDALQRQNGKQAGSLCSMFIRCGTGPEHQRPPAAVG
jgi:hypothetical protein